MRNVVSLLLVFFIGCTLLVSTTFAKWAYAFVVYDGNVYVISEAHVDPEQIGKVTKYSDIEGTYSGNFSNQFPKGTEYYEINGVKTKEAIAVKESEGVFIKANYNGKYDGIDENADSKKSWQDFVPYLLEVIWLTGIIFLVIKKRKN